MRKLMLLATMLFIVFAASTQASAQLLWKVENPETGKISYLFGTHHFAPVSMIDSVAGLREALQNSEKLYGEIDMKLMSDPQVIMGMQTRLTAPADSTLDKMITKAQLDSVAATWKRYTGMDMPAQLYMLKPAMLTTQFAALQSAKALNGMNLSEQLDATMQDLARQAGKEVASLETLDFQLDLLYGASITEQAADLMKTIREDEENCRKTLELTNAYIKQDMNALEKVMIEESEDIGSLDKLIFNRNMNWAKILAPEMKGKQLIVVVGAGHLPGEKGLIALLGKEGYKVTPVK